MVDIPFFQTAAFTEEITLDGTPYRLSLHWNHRGQFWVMDIRDREQNVLVAGIKVVVAYELIRRFAWREVPPGALVPVSTSAPYERIARCAIGDSVSLVYATEAEYAAL